MQTPLLMQSICWSLTQNKRKVQKNSITWWHRLCYMIAWLMFVQNKGGLCVHFLCCIFIYVCSPRWNIRSYKAHSRCYWICIFYSSFYFCFVFNFCFEFSLMSEWLCLFQFPSYCLKMFRFKWVFIHFSVTFSLLKYYFKENPHSHCNKSHNLLKAFDSQSCSHDRKSY